MMTALGSNLTSQHATFGGGAQHDASLGIEGEGDGVGLEVSGTQAWPVAEAAFHVTF